MNTPVGESSWLESFPPDIWAYFAWYLPGEQLGRLTMTGATRLWQRLKSPHVIKSVKLGEDFIVFKSFPRFLRELHSLSELCIHSNNDEWSRKLVLKIDSIPSGVRKLVLSGNWGKSADTLFGKDGATLKLNEHLPHLEVLDIPSLEFTDDTWMAHSPQSLTKLNLYRWNGNVELPTSLIHFKAELAHISTSSFVSKLPPSLETFEVSMLIGVELVVPLLPPSTHTLYLGDSSSCSGVISPQNLLEQLPKSLTCFQVPISVLGPVLNPELIRLLPSTLIDLKISPTIPCSAWHLLPPQLSKLSLNIQEVSLSTVASTTMDSHGVLHELRSVPFDSLPKSITSLELQGFISLLCGPPIDCNRSYFPPQLTYLKLDGVQLSPETAKLLPSSLTFLQIPNICERVCEHLPSSIKTLKSEIALITPNLIKFLPKSLTLLDIWIPDSNNTSWFDYNTGQTIDSVTKLEEFSIHQSCTSHSFDWKDHSPLPSTLTVLSIQYAIELGDTFLQHQQLPNLIQLDLAASKHFTDLSIPLLPRHLTVLDLAYSDKISGKSFKLLPRSLTQLNLESSESIFDSDVQHLPRTLKYVDLSNAMHLTELCIPDLPPHLEWLHMEFNSKISTSSFPKFPYSLRSSQIQYSAIFSRWQVSYGVILMK